MRSSNEKDALKRYNLALPTELYNALRTAADKKQVAIVDLLRQYIKLGLLATQVEETPGAALIIREGGTDRQIVLI